MRGPGGKDVLKEALHAFETPRERPEAGPYVERFGLQGEFILSTRQSISVTMLRVTGRTAAGLETV